MKITKSYLKKLIAEEVSKIISEQSASFPRTKGKFKTRGDQRMPRISGPGFRVHEGSIDGIPAYKFTVIGSSDPVSQVMAADTEFDILTIEQSFMDAHNELGKDRSMAAFKEYLIDNLKFKTISSEDYVNQIDVDKLHTLVRHVTRTAIRQNQSTNLAPHPLRVSRTRAGLEEPGPVTFTDRQPGRVNESKSSKSQIVLENHRKGRKLSPAVKNNWWQND